VTRPKTEAELSPVDREALALAIEHDLTRSDEAAAVQAALAQPDDHTGQRAAAELVQKMLSLGISRWHPDPLQAIAEAEATR
jgi:hypothetical protein